MKVNNLYEEDNVDFKKVTNLTQYLRFKVLAKLFENGIPGDKEDLDYFLKLTSACDKTSLDVKKAEGEEAMISTQVNAFKLVSETLNKVTKNPFLEDDDLKVPTYAKSPGEDVIGIDDCALDDLNSGN